ncbi:MAG: glycosyltransferase family 2 protein [Saprospiraceae bacterium]
MKNNKSGLITELPASPHDKSGWPWNIQVNPQIYEKHNYWPKISIVTPSFQQGRFIEETIRSILLQNYPNLEYIVMDGGSTDETFEILKKYDRWISYWVSKPDKGQTNALNNGFNLASGEICAYLNSDDLFLPNAFYFIINSYIYNNWNWVCSNTIVGKNTASKKIWKVNKKLSIHAFVAGQTFPQQGVFWKSTVLKKPYFNEKWKFIMDRAFFFEIFSEKGAPFRLNILTSFFREHIEAKTSTMQEVCQNETKSHIEEILNKFDDYFIKKCLKEMVRKENMSKITFLIMDNPDTVKMRIKNLYTAIHIIVKTPNLFRDRFFWSGLFRLFLKIFHI